MRAISAVTVETQNGPEVRPEIPFSEFPSGHLVVGPSSSDPSALVYQIMNDSEFSEHMQE